VEDDLNILKREDDLNILENERRPQYFCKRKSTSIFFPMEDNLNFLESGRRPQIFAIWNNLNVGK
jgi:hypothetical protein